MDRIDKDILKILQEEFPLAERPFKSVADRLGIGEDEAIRRVAALRGAGVIRRIGAVLDAGALGVATILCAAAVPEERVETVARIVSAFSQVTHNYQRSGRYNLWFTVWERDRQHLETVVKEIEREAGVSLLRLPAVKTYKIRAVFDPS